jgi:hypothetical protein
VSDARASATKERGAEVSFIGQRGTTLPRYSRTDVVNQGQERICVIVSVRGTPFAALESVLSRNSRARVTPRGFVYCESQNQFCACARFALMRGPRECSLERRSPESGETYPSAIYLGLRIIAIDSPARIIALDLPFHLVAGWQGGTTN